MTHRIKIVIVAIFLIRSVIGQSANQLQNSNNNQINQSLLREQMLQSQVEKSNQSLDDLLKLEEQFESTNVPVKIIVTPSDIEEYYRLKLKRIRDDIIGLNMIETLLDTAGAIKYYGYDYDRQKYYPVT